MNLSISRAGKKELRGGILSGSKPRVRERGIWGRVGEKNFIYSLLLLK
jgi:hypothetical protein